jgi:hypothetical protein
MEVKRIPKDASATLILPTKRYQQPILKQYGSVKALTATGTGSDREGSCSGPNPGPTCITTRRAG